MIKMGSVMLAGKAALALLTLRFKSSFAVLALGAAAANYFSDPISQFIVSVTDALQEGIPGLFKLFTGGGDNQIQQNLHLILVQVITIQQ